MDGMNVDDVSANFSNLSVTTNTFLSLPWLVKWHIYMNLYSRDCIALSSTCRQMYDFNTFAYTHLLFLPPNSLFSLARSIQRLSEVLARSPRYAEAVRTLRIVGWNAIDIPGSLDPHIVYRSLDEGVSSVLEKAPHIFLLTLDLDHPQPAPRNILDPNVPQPAAGTHSNRDATCVRAGEPESV